jgi:hypothetical protein
LAPTKLQVWISLCVDLLLAFLVPVKVDEEFAVIATLAIT